MLTILNSRKTAAAIGSAMESACAAGDLEAAERLFASYRLLFAEQHWHERPPAEQAFRSFKN